MIWLINTLIFIAIMSAWILPVWFFLDWVYDGKITTFAKRLIYRNNTYKCHGCDRLHREYQRYLTHAAKGYESCPHCGKSGYGLISIKKPDKWMNSHSDCLKLNLIGYMKILKAISAISRLKREKEEIERFEAYNGLKADINWIRKLEKDLSR